jgi:hypothetical protein
LLLSLEVVLTPTQLAYISRHNFQPLTADR